MRLLSVIIILLPVVWYLINRNKNNSVFSPLNAYTFLYFIKIVLPVIVYSIPSKIPIVEYDFLQDALSSDEDFFKYSILQSISYVLVLLGIKWVSNKFLGKKDGCTNLKSSTFYDNGAIVYIKGSTLFFLIGITGFILIMSKVGGLSFFLSNLQNRTTLLRDLDFESYMLLFLNYAPLLVIYSKKWTKSKITIVDIVLIVLAGLMSGLGGRKALIILFIECIVIYHYVVKRIQIKNFFNYKVISIVVLSYLFFTTYSHLRKEGAYELFINNPISFYSENAGDVIDNIATESYVAQYVSIVKHFDVYEKWHGASYKGLITAFIPSSLYPHKPPVDDGMYLYAIANGNYNIKPPVPTELLNVTSWPLETFGAMYANFDIFGVFIGMLLLGAILGLCYNKMIKSNYSFLYVTFYTIMLTTFELSTLRLVQAVTAFVLLFIIQFSIERFHKC